MSYPKEIKDLSAEEAELLKVRGMKPILTLYHKQRKNLYKLVGKHSGQQEEYIEVFLKVLQAGKLNDQQNELC